MMGAGRTARSCSLIGVAEAEMGFFGAADSQAIEMLPGVTRKMLSCGEHMMVVKVVLARGSVVPMHSHPHEQTGHVRSGRLRFWIGEEERVLGPDEGYAVPPYLQHACEALEDTIAIDTFSPPREEYR
jgi:quercetin dioxygenase-like cupin family protein